MSVLQKFMWCNGDSPLVNFSSLNILSVKNTPDKSAGFLLISDDSSQRLLTWSRKIKLLEPSEGIFSILVSENDLFLTLGLGTSSARNKNRRPLLNTNIPLISGEYGLRNHFWPLESRFLMRKNEKKSIFSLGPNGPILQFFLWSNIWWDLWKYLRTVRTI